MSTELKPWYTVAIPHEDIQKGRLSEAVFAANLWAVVQGTAPEIYTDAETFFDKTYLTAGLTKVLKKAASALSGDADAGDRILSLQTAFGGGKTHALVALWHLANNTDKIKKASGCAEVRKVLGQILPKKVKAVAVFTNQSCDATQGRKTSEGIRTRTMWGEIAVQLGGKELYADIKANDENRTAPKGLFVDILKKAAPCLILLDEVADYCVAASAVKVEDSTLADQTVSFIQELTESAQQVEGVALVATLPASHLEVASAEKGEELLKRLEKRFGRMSADNTPVADNEIYEVVRRRLFETLGKPADHEATAEAYMKVYQQHRNELPSEASRATYKEHIIAAYPFHPSLIDALYLRWGSHGDFQRTRGVLRLLASVVADLWQRRKNESQSQLLIQPCHIHWTIDALHAALTRLWGTQYESVVANDVIGKKANAVLLDEERGDEYQRERIVEGLASAILLGSFGGQGERTGYGTKELKLCVGRPDLNWGYTDGALLALEERGFYLHTTSAGSQGKRYWFGTKPTLTKLIVQYRGQFSSQNLDTELIETVQEQAKNIKTGLGGWRVLVNPEPDLPEQKSLTLLVMPPDSVYSDERNGAVGKTSVSEENVLSLSRKCGKKDRLYRNTLIFLLPSSRGLSRLRNAILEVKVLEAVKRDYGTQLDDEQKTDLNNKMAISRKAVGEAVGGAYTYVARIEGQKLVVCALNDTRASFSDHLEIVWKQILEEEEWVLKKVGTVTLQKTGIIPETGGLRVKDALEAFLRYTDKPMITSRHAVLEGLSHACKEKVIGLARGLNLEKLQSKWCGEYVTLDLEEEGFWIIPPFTPEQVDKPGDATPQAKPGKDGSTGSVDIASTDKDETEPTTTTARTKRIKITGKVPLESWSDLFRCFINPAARMNLKKLDLGVEFEMVPGNEQKLPTDHPTVKAMQESARQLGLEIEIDEE